MSHLARRKETNCLNCGTTVIGAYCHVCGQEKLEPKESLWYLIVHFFNDVTHFDGKFFSSLKDILFKPGFLSKEYMKGYLFFLLLFPFFKFKKLNNESRY